MTEYQIQPGERGQIHPFIALLLLVVLVILGLFVGNLLGMIAVLLLSDLQFSQISQLVADPSAFPDARISLLTIQGFAALGAFIIGPLYYKRIFEKNNPSPLSTNHYINLTIIIITTSIVIFSMPLNAVVVEWNKGIRLPSFLAELEEWAMNKENAMQEVTLYITDFDNIWQFMFGLLVVAVLPGIGEELLFRGMMQPKIIKLSGNIHAGIWITALIFSFFHFQFYGLFPRMLLGALFGYLYVWTGNLVIPMIAHFVNNGFTLLMIYLNKAKVTSLDIESTESVPTYAALISAVITATLLSVLYTYYKHLRNKGVISFTKNE